MDSSTLFPLWNGFVYKPHQITGVHWMLNREKDAISGGLLCDEMGLGKTMEVLGTMKNNKLLTTLLLCPKAVISQWVDAARRSSINVCVMNDEKDGWTRPRPFTSGQPFLYVTNYEKLLSRMFLFKRLKINRLVLDEAHKVSNRNGKLYQQITEIKRDTTWCVTATPIVNDLKDMRNLFGLVGYDYKALTNYSKLLGTVSQACLHRSMEEMREVIPELPDAAIIKKEVLDFETEDEAEFYRGIQGSLAKRFRMLSRDHSKAIFQLIMRLRQLSLHPQVYINARKKEVFGYTRPDWSESSTKFSTLRKKLEEQETYSKWIVFCQFHDEMDILDAYLSKSTSVGRVQLYHGGMTQEEKDDVIENTKTDVEGHDILLLQLHSGGVGLNLQHFTKIIFMSPWWTSALMDQAIGRAVRIGQNETVEVTLLVLKEEETMNIDEKMLEKASAKKGILENVFKHASRGDEQGDMLYEEDLEEDESGWARNREDAEEAGEAEEAEPIENDSEDPK
jgi:SNF2 family DNA or RNA helicase